MSTVVLFADYVIDYIQDVDLKGMNGACFLVSLDFQVARTHFCLFHNARDMFLFDLFLG